MIERPLCIIPARGSSKRFPRKNIALLNGKPLLAYTIEAARDSKVFSSIYVSSEDDEILDVAHRFGADCVCRRPEQLAGDHVQVKQVCSYILNEMREQGEFYSTFAVLLPTSPLRTTEDIQNAYDAYRERDGNVLMSLVAFSHPPQRAVYISGSDGYVRPFFGMQYMKQAQLLEPLYRHDGAIVIADVETYLAEGELYGSKTIPYIMSPDRAVDIDTPEDLERAAYLLEKMRDASRVVE